MEDSRVIYSKLPLWEFIFILLCILYFIIPVAHASFNFVVAIAIGFLYSIYLVAAKKERGRVIITFLIVIIYIATLYTFLTNAGSIGDVSNRSLKRFFSKLYQYLCMFFPLLLLSRTIKSATRRQKILMLLVALVAILFSSKTILDYISINELAARSFNRESDEDLGPGFIAPYPFVYGMTFVVLTAFLLFRYAKSMDTKLKFIVIIILVFFIYFLFKSQFTLALVTTTISMAIIVYRTSNTQVGKIAAILIIIFIFFIMPFILDFLISVSPRMLAQRFGELKTLFTGQVSADDESDMMGRFDLYGNAIAAFLRSPIWGNKYLNFDGHATYLMVWADLGVLGGIPVFILLFKAKKIVDYLLQNSIIFLPLFIHLLILGFTNPVHASLQIDIMIWYLAPLSLNYFITKI